MEVQMRLRTKLLLFFTAFFGVGIGVLSGLSDGAYSAVCLFMMPLLVAFTGASILGDLNQPVAPIEVVKEPARVEVRPAVQFEPWKMPPPQEASRPRPY